MRDVQPPAGRQSPLIAHLIYRLGVGGLENGLVNLINHMPPERYRHAILSITQCTDFANRIQRKDVQFYDLNKRPGQDWMLYYRLWRLFRRLRPTILHTRNLAALEGHIPGVAAGIHHRIHSEHGREESWRSCDDPRHTLLRRLISPLVDTYIPLSQDMEGWLKSVIRVPIHKITQIYNGVDTEKFHPSTPRSSAALPQDFAPADCLVIGTAGRLQPIKDQITLVKAFIHLLQTRPDLRRKMRLVIAGDGEPRPHFLALLESANFGDRAWLPGYRDNVPELLRCLDIFVLPSIGEGISNSILEAMATGLPVVATNVGGNPELVLDGVTGCLVPKQDPEAMASAICSYIDNPAKLAAHGQAARERCEKMFSIGSMVGRYLLAYDRLVYPMSSNPALQRTAHFI